jgi:hypothetical protein
MTINRILRRAKQNSNEVVKTTSLDKSCDNWFSTREWEQTLGSKLSDITQEAYDRRFFILSDSTVKDLLSVVTN